MATNPNDIVTNETNITGELTVAGVISSSDSSNVTGREDFTDDANFIGTYNGLTPPASTNTTGTTNVGGANTTPGAASGLSSSEGGEHGGSGHGDSVCPQLGIHGQGGKGGSGGLTPPASTSTTGTTNVGGVNATPGAASGLSSSEGGEHGGTDRGDSVCPQLGINVLSGQRGSGGLSGNGPPEFKLEQQSTQNPTLMRAGSKTFPALLSKQAEGVEPMNNTDSSGLANDSKGIGRFGGLDLPEKFGVLQDLSQPNQLMQDSVVSQIPEGPLSNLQAINQLAMSLSQSLVSTVHRQQSTIDAGQPSSLEHLCEEINSLKEKLNTQTDSVLKMDSEQRRINIVASERLNRIEKKVDQKSNVDDKIDKYIMWMRDLQKEGKELNSQMESVLKKDSEQRRINIAASERLDRIEKKVDQKSNVDDKIDKYIMWKRDLQKEGKEGALAIEGYLKASVMAIGLLLSTYGVIYSLRSYLLLFCCSAGLGAFVCALFLNIRDTNCNLQELSEREFVLHNAVTNFKASDEWRNAMGKVERVSEESSTDVTLHEPLLSHSMDISLNHDASYVYANFQTIMDQKIRRFERRNYLILGCALVFSCAFIFRLLNAIWNS